MPPNACFNQEIPAVACGFSSRRDNNMSLSYGNTGNSLANRRNFLEGLGIDYRTLVCAQQTHSGNVRVIKKRIAAGGIIV